MPRSGAYIVFELRGLDGLVWHDLKMWGDGPFEQKRHLIKVSGVGA